MNTYSYEVQFQLNPAQEKSGEEDRVYDEIKHFETELHKRLAIARKPKIAMSKQEMPKQEMPKKENGKNKKFGRQKAK